MTERIRMELELLRRHRPDLEFREEGDWILFPQYSLPAELWVPDTAALAVQFPSGYPGNGPYGFHVSPPPRLKNGGEPQNATPSAEPPFEGNWLKFSWSLPEWRATADLGSGFNMLNFVLTIPHRLEQGA